ncbi:acyl-CoA/acyl-ACP dehydrogenase [Rhodoblastus acidophilus]|uniref:Acyl-CoA/acyl-ACP dehydrogenase n=1 Tax=Candidatus Rhodoblastus alkanivorans TaxID=2954117 RepID=A0ABS9Z5Q8_9HYPH|nr:acyl-CoA dehydrogenase family protein [Candidatus Rhodoblastus alkanivorans]MCI4679867.1 acyl-CoA/acyl-ACP dehydrogenase [Candidatus Rhodoblastus alkanivorans]MCI4682730.1 acyl-CoA/acyl-ACP dehydrogenase [Candidatus Rhodoblastus alkanivorans]MDI4640037.1 acyl-CoA/acyl-ACP dehydrogenase [Rhodoblastus acidophilus]
MTVFLDLKALPQIIGPRIAEGAAERDESDAFVAENYKILKEYKLFSALVPSDLGGGGARHSAMCGFLRELAQYCPSTALSLSMHQHVVAAAAYHHRNGRPGRKLLERVAASEAVLISTGANDWLESSGTVERVDGGFRVTAKKPFGSGSPAGDMIVTSAPYQDPGEGWQVLHFAIPFTAQGVSLADDWRGLGMRATGSRTIILDRVFIPDDAVALRRPRGRFHPAWSVILTVALPLIMSVYVGVAEAVAEKGLALAKKRGCDSVTPCLLGELGNRLTTAQIAADDMVRRANDLNFEMSVDLAGAMLTRKTIVAENVLATAEKALEAAGGAGFYRAAGIERLLRDAHAAQFHPLPAKRQQVFTGRLALGLDPVGEAA